MKHLPAIAGALLGLLFLFASANYFLHLMPMPNDPSPANAPHRLFMGALIPTGYFAFVKVVEMLGGLLAAVPKTRNLGLLALGPVIVNILCFHVFLNKGATLVDPMTIAIVVLSLFLLWTERSAFAKLVTR